MMGGFFLPESGILTQSEISHECSGKQQGLYVPDLRMDLQ